MSLQCLHVDAINRGEPTGVYLLSRHSLLLLLRRCSPPRVVAVKSIRLGVGVGGKDYDLGRLKVLHLVRDPRGVVRSQRKQFKMFWGAPSGADSATIAHAGGARWES